MSVVSVDAAGDSARGKRILAKAALVIVIILALVGVASLAERFLGL